MMKLYRWTSLVALLIATVLSIEASSPSTPSSEKLCTKAGATTASATLAKASQPAASAKKSRSLLKLRKRSAAKTPAGRLRTPLKSINALHRRTPATAEAPGKGSIPSMYGAMAYSEEWPDGSFQFGVYTIPVAEGENFDLVVPDVNAHCGGVMVGDIYYWCDIVQNDNFEIESINYTGVDVNNGARVFSGTGDYNTLSMTYDKTTGTIYAIMDINGIPVLTTLSFDNGFHYTQVAEFKGDYNASVSDWNCIACDKNGQLYGITYDYDTATYDIVSNTLHKINKTDGTVTKIGPTGFLGEYSSDAVIDQNTNRMFWTVSEFVEGYLCEVNLATGTATKIYDFPGNEQICGLVIPASAIQDKAPAAVTDATADFAGGSLTGTVAFTAPSTLYDGTVASGNLTYTVNANGAAVATGQTKYGSAVSAPITLDKAGLYTFQIFVKNDSGTSPSVKLQNIFVGHDTPKPTTATLEYSDGMMRLSWLPVTSAVNGGFIDPVAVRYTVRRVAGSAEPVTVAENLSATTFSEPIAKPDQITQFHYEVVATYDGKSSESTSSNAVVIGSIAPPYTANLVNDFQFFTVDDANHDGKTWAINNGRLYVPYNMDMVMDDWLFSPPLKLEKGNLYDLIAAISAQRDIYPERIEIKYGNAPTPEAMTGTLLPASVITAPFDAPMFWNYSMFAEESGDCYIGFHGISDKDSYSLWLHSFSVSEGHSSNAPGAGELTVTPGKNGALTAKIRFVVPVKNLDGSDLTSLTSVELTRGGEVVKTWNNPAPGDILPFQEIVPAEGEYTYTAVCKNENGNGMPVSKNVFIGVNYPAPITNLTWSETSRAGEVKISWDAVTKDITGNELDSYMVSYQVFSVNGVGEMTPLTGKISSNSYTYQAVQNGKQTFIQYAVFAYTKKGEGEGAVTEFGPVGTPYPGMVFSAYSDFDRYALSTSDEGGASWGFYSDDILDVKSVDSDNFFFAMFSEYLHKFADVFTGYITLKDMTNPAVSFYTFNAELRGGNANINDITVYVREKGQKEWTLLKKAVANEVAPLQGWGKVIAGLADYAGKTVQLKFTGTANAAAYTYMDRIVVGPILDNDLSLTQLSSPESAALGKKYTVTANILNEGSKESGEYSVELYSDDNLVDTKKCASLKAGESAKVDFECVMSGLATEPVAHNAKIVYAQDGNLDNNASDVIEIEPVMPAYPVVTDLAGEVEDKKVNLSWSIPDLSKAPGEAVTEDFESGEAFADHFGDWTFVDEDGKPVGGFNEIEIPNITSYETPGSFWVWDASQLGNYTFAAHSGNKYLFSLFNRGQVDDWAISPQLDGSAQTVSFYAKSYTSAYPEEIELLYSEGSLNTFNFVQIEGAGGTVPNEWTLYEVELPAGAKYFAIRSYSEDKMMLMIDDVTFIPQGAKHNLVINGYNVYRDGVKLNSEPVQTTSFTDSGVEDNNSYLYKVTVAYNKGESAASNPAKVDVNLSDIDSTVEDEVGISVNDRNILVSNAEGIGIEVYSADGKLLQAVTGRAQTVIPVTPGIYIVKAGNTTRKTIVK